MRTTLNAFNTAINTFKSHYETYDQAREQVSTMKDCRNSMTEFQAKLADARQKRQRVYDDIVKIQTILTPEITGQYEVLYQRLLTPEIKGEAL